MNNEINNEKIKNDFLIDRIYNFLQNNKDNLNVELKPNEYSNLEDNDSQFNFKYKKDLEVIQKDYSTQIDKQLDIISNNIAIKFFELNDEKFQAILERIMLWGYDLCLEEFILNYYLIIKKDNRLRQFIILHLIKLISRLKNIIEKQLILKMNNFNFINDEDDELKTLNYKLAEKEAKLLELNPEKIAEDNSPEIITTDKINSIKNEILNDLKKNNPELEEGI